MSQIEDHLFSDLSYTLRCYLKDLGAGKINPDEARDMTDLLIEHATDEIKGGKKLVRIDPEDDERPFDSVLELPKSATDEETRKIMLPWMTYSLDNGYRLGSIDLTDNTIAVFTFEARR